MLNIVPAPSQAKTDERFCVQVRQGAGPWLPVSVYLALTHDGVSNWNRQPQELYEEFDGITHGTIAVKTFFASFGFDGEVQVRITHKNSTDLQIRPFDACASSYEDGALLLTLTEPCKLCIEPDGDIFGALHLFAEALPAPLPSGYRNVIHFQKGYHTAENSDLITYNADRVPVVAGITDDTLIYAEPGAVVHAVVEIKSCSHICIAGQGIFSLLDRAPYADKNFDVPTIYGCFRKCALPSIFIHGGCRDITVTDVTLICEYRGITIRNAEDLNISNVKLFSFAANGDGVNAIKVCRMDISDCYFQCSDDCLAFYTNYDDKVNLNDPPELTARAYTADVTVRHCLLWTTCRPFMFGGHGTGSTAPHDVLENIRVTDCEVLAVASNIKGNTEEHKRYWSGIFRILSQSQAHIRNIFFSDILVHWTKGYTGKAIHFEIRSAEKASYSESEGYCIEQVVLDRIRFLGVPEDRMESMMHTADDPRPGYGIRDITLRNVFFDGEPFPTNEISVEGRVSDLFIHA